MFENISTGNTYMNLFNGEWQILRQNSTIDIHSPVNGKIIGKVESMNKMQIDRVIENSRNSQKHWAEVPVNERAAILHKAAAILEENIDEIAQLLQCEIAKDKNSSISEVKRTADFIRFTADEGKHIEGKTIAAENFPGFKQNKISFVTRVPVGVVLAISPFNYPINLSASKIAPALMAGNSVILKPPSQGVICALHLAEVFNKAGVPAGVLTTVTGKGTEIGDYLVTHKYINFINFTGSTKVGHHIASIAGMIPMLMELGGKDAAIVLKDADIESTAKNIVSGAYNYSGQRCTAVKRVIVINEIAEKLINNLKAEIDKLKIGTPEEGADITPLIDDNGASYVQELIDDAIKKGAKLIIGNKRENNLIYPTLFDYVTSDMRIAWEEPFGPVLPVMRVNDIDEAIKLANESQYGLQSAVFTENINDAFYISNKLEVGTVQINNKSERGPDNFPFLGVKDSGIGTQGIKYSIEAMSRPKAVVLNLE